MAEKTADVVPSRCLFTVKQRLAVLDYARSHGLVAASRRFGSEPQDYPRVAHA